MKGRIQGGIVNAYGVETVAGHFRLGATPLTRPVRTNADGSYRLEINMDSSSPWVSDQSGLVIQLTADDRTTMVCDLPAGCEKTDGTTVPYGGQMQVPQDFQLYTTLPRISPGQVSAHLTPLSHLAYRWAEQQLDGLSPDNIQAGRQKIAAVFGLPQDVFEVRPIDLTQMQSEMSRRVLDKTALESSLLSAAFLSLVDSDQERHLTQVLEASAQAIAAPGITPNKETLLDSTEIKAQLSRSIASIAQSLSEELVSTPAGDSLTPISTLVGHLSEIRGKVQPEPEVVSPGPETYEPPRITHYPVSRQLRPQEEITLNINASGSDPLKYQWRKDGISIPGASAQHYTIASFGQQDEGVYDCIVSNAAGTVVSPSATLLLARASITLGWTPPNRRLDGTPLELLDIRGYQLMYGTTQDHLDQSVEITDPHRTQYTFEHLPSDTYYFAIRAIDHAGTESLLSEVIDVEL